MGEEIRIETRIGILKDCLKIQSVVNEAFMADAFFKKEEYHLRFADGEVKTMMNATNSCWILAILNNEIVGCIYLKWKVVYSNNDKNNKNNTDSIHGHFSSVSVLDSMARKGIGRTLVKAAEDHVINLGKNNDSSNSNPPRITIDCGVINLREDLFKWYGNQGYVNTGEEIKDDEEVNRITLPGMMVTLVIIGKTLL